MADLYAHHRLLLTAYVVALLVATLAPVPDVAYPPSGFDKLVHVVLFAGLAFLLHAYLGSRRAHGAWLPFALTLGVAGLIEVVQGVLPFRNADEWDFVAGAAGAAVGVAGSHVLERFRRGGASAVDSSSSAEDQSSSTGSP